MGRFSRIVIPTLIVAIGALFFISGYSISRSLLHASMPPVQKASRKPNVDVAAVVGAAGNVAEIGGGSDFAREGLETLNGLLNNNVPRKPSEFVQQKKSEPVENFSELHARQPFVPF
jgi:hypothetical protein